MSQAAVSILVLGTADWDQAIATNQHYMCRELAHDFDVTFVESTGLRRPQLRWRDVRRVLRRVQLQFAKTSSLGGTGGGRLKPDRLHVVSPVVIPFHNRWTGRLNSALVRRSVARWLRSDGPRVLWSYTPVAFGLTKAADAVVYHCVDLLGEVDGISTQLVDSSELLLSKSTDVAIASSAAVERNLNDKRFREVRLWPNVADSHRISAAQSAQITRHARRVVFAGNLTTSKVDFNLLMEAVNAGLDVHLAGPISEGGGNAQAEVDSLCARGATYHGALDLDALAALLWSASAGLIPYVQTRYTRGVNPLKIYEYLAAGLPVISTPIPAVSALQSADVVVVRSADFTSALQLQIGAARLTSGDVARRVGIAEANSWVGRGRQAVDLVRELTT